MRVTKAFALLLLLLFSMATFVLGVRIENFEQPGTWQMTRSEEWGGTFTLDKSPDGTGLAGKWSWGEKHNNYQEVHLVRAKDLPGFEDACDGTVSFRV
ncbi:MAG TPA: hypothetical protein VHV83_03590, partial [Armatimonadota bacterium]|nr:hypothetical protein [Armatimonadota bacterium]